MHRAWVLLILIEEGFALAQRTKESFSQNEGSPPQNLNECGTWVRNINGGVFTSPNYPNTYPPNKECVYILEALPRQRIQLAFDKNYYMEPSFECRFDHIEVRDGPFGFSPIIDRFCGSKNPGLVTSTGRFMWIKFTSDEELEGVGFRIKYIFIADPDFHLHVGGLLNPIPDCQFEVGGYDGVIRSSQVEEEDKIKTGDALDCIWTIRAPPQSKVNILLPRSFSPVAKWVITSLTAEVQPLKTHPLIRTQETGSKTHQSPDPLSAVETKLAVSQISRSITRAAGIRPIMQKIESAVLGMKLKAVT